MSGFIFVHKQDNTVLAVNPDLIRFVCQDQNKVTTIIFDTHTNPNALIRITESMTEVFEMINTALDTGSRQAFAMAHDAFMGQRYGLNTKLLRAISEDGKGRAVLIFDQIFEDEKWVTVSESLSEMVTECNRANQARVSRVQ